MCTSKSLQEHKEDNMAKIYAQLIRKGLKTIEDVPEQLRAAVQELLDGEPDAS